MTAANDVTEVTTDRDERRWDRWSRLILLIGILLVVWPVLTTLYAYRFPTDGWSSAPNDGFRVGGQYRMLEPLIADTPLQPNDIVVAIDGRPLLPDTPPPLPSDLVAGQTLRYTLNRAGQAVEADVTLVQLGLAALLRNQLQLLRDNPGNSLFVLAMAAIATIVFLLRPGSLAARYLFLFAAFDLGISFQSTSDLYAFTFPRWLSFAQNLYGWGWMYVFLPTITLLVLVFPVRKWPVRRFPRLLPAALIGLPLVVSIVANSLVWFGGNLPAYRLIWPLTFYSAVWALSLIPITLIHNLLTIREPLAKAQMRWLSLGFGLGFVLPLVVLITSVESLPVFDPRRDAIVIVGNLALLILPICLAIAILRYRLFDIDVIIRRTTSYAILTALLALVYFGSIVVLQQLLTPFTGESDVAVVLSTLLIAALFLPLRRRVQTVIDRRFFRQKYDAEKVLAQFAATARDETDLDTLTAELLRVIQETMQPEQVSIWLKPTADDRPQTTDRRPQTADHRPLTTSRRE